MEKDQKIIKFIKAGHNILPSYIFPEKVNYPEHEPTFQLNNTSKLYGEIVKLNHLTCTLYLHRVLRGCIYYAFFGYFSCFSFAFMSYNEENQYLDGNRNISYIIGKCFQQKCIYVTRQCDLYIIIDFCRLRYWYFSRLYSTITNATNVISI